MKKAQEIEIEFRNKLSALFREYGAEMMGVEDSCGYQSYFDYIEVYIPAIWNSEHEQISETVEINLGRSYYGES